MPKAWLTRLAVVTVLIASGVAEEYCKDQEPLYANALSQLDPWLEGIQEGHLEAAADLLRAEADYHYGPEYPYAADDSQFNLYPKHNLSLNASDASFPWSSITLVKLVLVNGTFWLPSGPISPLPWDQGFSTRCFGFMLDELVRLAARFSIPDLELIIRAGDFTLVHGPASNGFVPPLFAASSGHSAMDICLPDCYQMYNEMSFEPDWLAAVQAHEEQLPWAKRIGKVVGRYNAVCPRGHPVRDRQHNDLGCPRIEVHKLTHSEKNHQEGLLNAGLYAGNDAFVETRNMPNLAHISMVEQLEYKYVLNLDGLTTAFRAPLNLASGQTVLTPAGASTRAFYSQSLRPWEHYVPVAKSSWDDIFGTVRWLEEHPDLAQRIANNSQSFARKHLGEKGRDCYTLYLLRTYASLLKAKPKPLDAYSNAVPLEGAVARLQAETVLFRQHLEKRQKGT